MFGAICEISICNSFLDLKYGVYDKILRSGFLYACACVGVLARVFAHVCLEINVKDFYKRTTCGILAIGDGIVALGAGTGARGADALASAVDGVLTAGQAGLTVRRCAPRRTGCAPSCGSPACRLHGRIEGIGENTNFLSIRGFWSEVSSGRVGMGRVRKS